MKICLITDDYLPSSRKVAGKMMHELALEFKSRGHNVSVVTPSAGLKKSFEISQLDGVTVCHFRSGEIKNVSNAKRAINETLLSYNAWQALQLYFKQFHHDFIIYYSPTIFWGGLVSRLKKLWGAGSYLILRDFFPQWVIDNGMLSAYSPITQYFRFFEALTYRAADTIGVQLPKDVDCFCEISNIKRQLDILYNWAAIEPPPANTGEFRKTLGLENKVVFFYGGNIGQAQDMMNIVRLAQAMRQEPDAHFLLVGAGDQVDLVQEAIAQNDLNNMTLLPSVNQDVFKIMLKEFDVGLFSLHRDHTTDNCPGKLLAYMVQEKPILGSVNPHNDLRGLLEKAKAGLVTINGDDAALLNNALKLLRDSNLRQSLGSNAKRLLSDIFSVQAAANTILAKINI